MDAPNQPPKAPGKVRFYFTLDGETVEGPIDADKLLMAVTTEEIPGTVRVCKEGTEIWVEFNEIPDSEFTPQGIAEMNRVVPEIIDKKNKEAAEQLGKEIGSNPIVGIGCAIVLGIIVFVIWAMMS